VTGGFVPFAERVQVELGVDRVQANRLEARAGRLTGRVLPPLRGPTDKLRLLIGLATEHRLRRAQTLAVGDGANDLPMLGAAGLGVAFRPHPRVAAAVPVTIRHGGLSTLLYLQGIARQDFAAP
jgi:phosphoserine phosphatase